MNRTAIGMKFKKSGLLHVLQGGVIRIADQIEDIPRLFGAKSRFGELTSIAGHEGYINVLGILRNVYTGKIQMAWGINLVGDNGDIHYAQDGAEEAPTNVFGIMELGTAGGAPAKTSNRDAITAFVASSQKAHDATYPTRNDSDSDNTGAGVDVVTYRTSYTTGEANSAGIDRGIITNVTPAAAEPTLTYYTITAFTKTSSDTLKFFTNHTFNGV